MKMYYITLNTELEAEAISYTLLQKQLAVCTNWFPVTCAYRWQGEVKHEPEVVLILKTQTGMRDAIAAVVAQHVHYTHFLAELDVHSVNENFLGWLNKEVPPKD